jgi:hypothetical protein
MKQLLLFVLFSFGFTSVFAQAFPGDSDLHIDTLLQKQPVGFTTTNDSLNTLSFQSISKGDFEGYKKKYKPQIGVNEKGVIRADTSFRLKTLSRQKNFRNNPKNTIVLNTYIGYIEWLNLFVVDYVNGYNAVQELYLIDRISGKNYSFSSPFDNGMTAPLLSPNGKYLLSYSNNVFEDNQCFISILKINKQKNAYTLDSYLGLQVNKWKVFDITWINDDTIALSAGEKNTKAGTGGKTLHFKAKVPEEKISKK